MCEITISHSEYFYVDLLFEGICVLHSANMQAKENDKLMKLISFIHTYTHVHAHSHAHIRYRLINGVARNGYFIINYLFKWRCHCDRNDGTLLLLLLLLRSFYMARAASMLSCGFKNRIVSSKINRFNSSRGKSSNSISRRNGLSATG